jgi:hypothetical protein
MSEARDDLIDDTVRKIVLSWIISQIGEGEDCNRWPIACSRTI